MIVKVTASLVSWYRHKGRLIRVISREGRRYIIEVSDFRL